MSPPQQDVETRQLRIATIRANPDQPRKLFDQEALEGLASSIKENGLLQPLVVRPDPDPDSGFEWMLVAGERRWRAHHLGEIETAPCRILEAMDDVKAFELATLENVGREDMTVIEEAKAYQQLLNAGREIPELAATFGKTEMHIKWRLDLLTLTDEVMLLVEQGEITRDLAWYIAQCNASNQHRIVARLANGEFKSTHEASAFARELAKSETEIEMFSDNLSDEEREKRAARRKRAKTTVERMEALASILGRINAMKPQELYDALEGEVGLFDDKLDIVHKAVNKARSISRHAKAIAKVREEQGGSERVTEEASAEKGQ